jgi:hypothetical protein
MHRHNILKQNPEGHQVEGPDVAEEHRKIRRWPHYEEDGKLYTAGNAYPGFLIAFKIVMAVGM